MKSKKGINKVCIMGLDALEYDLVEKWDLKNLKQKEYGKIDLSINPKNTATPIIWTSFITGKDPEEHGIKSDRKWDSGFIETIANIKKKLVRDFDLDIFKSSLFNRSTAKRLGFGCRPVNKEDHGLKTIFDYFPETSVISLPGYNEWQDALEVRNSLIMAENGEVKKEVCKEKSLELFEKKKKVTFEKINDDWKIFMPYFYVLDPLQHIFYYDEDYIEKMYREINKLVEEIKERLDEKTLLLIIADHGQKDGHHTNYGFYSSNKELGLKSPELTSFYGLINEVLGGPTKEQEEKIKRHLEELGYTI